MKARNTAVACVAAAAALGPAPAALANGPCGVDFDSNHACGLTTPYAVNGSIVTDNESDYYVFYGNAGIQVSVTLTNTADPNACEFTIDCKSMNVGLLDSSGGYVDGASYSAPTNGVTVPISFSHTLDSTGVYYLQVTGEPGTYDNGTGAIPMPYSLNVSANPDVQWPPPPSPPPCVVPRFGGQTVNTVRYRLAANHCRAGRVYMQFNRARRGVVLGLGRGRVGSHSGFAWPPGTRLPFGTVFDLEVSRGRRHR